MAGSRPPLKQKKKKKKGKSIKISKKGLLGAVKTHNDHLKEALKYGN